MSGFIPTLPYYEVKRGLTSENKTMRLEYEPQDIDGKRMQFTCQGISNIQKLFAELTKYPDILKSIPDSNGRNLELFTEAQKRGIYTPPISPLARVDIVGGKVVDINTKPSGFGLISSAEINWKDKTIFPDSNIPISADFNKLQTGEFESIVVVTESNYPFVSDQIAFAKLASIQTGKAWRIIFSDQTKPQIQEGEGVYCFSWLSASMISSDWRDYLFSNQEKFILNPLTGIWDNKALMALPFLEQGILNSRLGMKLLKIKKMFPETYLFRSPSDTLEMAVSVNNTGIEYQEANKFNVPSQGEYYLKPILESGARGVVVKMLQDKGTAINTLKRYSEKYGSFIVQNKVQPEKVRGFNIKDGYFIEFQEPYRFITIERMGVRGETNLIHGGSSSLIPLSVTSEK